MTLSPFLSDCQSGLSFFVFFDLVKQLEFVSMPFSWIALRRSPFQPDIIYSGHDGANGMGRSKGTNTPVNGNDGGESQVPILSNHRSHTSLNFIIFHGKPKKMTLL